jgi:hypothetical protein
MIKLEALATAASGAMGRALRYDRLVALFAAQQAVTQASLELVTAATARALALR